MLGVRSYASLRDLPLQPDVVNVFRLLGAIGAIVDNMIEPGYDQLWVQQGIVDLTAAARAEAHNICMVMDRCMMVEHRNMQR